MIGPIMWFRARVVCRRQAISTAGSRSSADVYPPDVVRNVPKPMTAKGLRASSCRVLKDLG